MRKEFEKSVENCAIRDGEILRSWLLNTVPRAKYNDVVRKITEACMVKESRLRNWFYMTSKIPELYKREINKVAFELYGEEIFNIAESNEK